MLIGKLKCSECGARKYKRDFRDYLNNGKICRDCENKSIDKGASPMVEQPPGGKNNDNSRRKKAIFINLDESNLGPAARAILRGWRNAGKRAYFPHGR